jgi:integrase
VVVLGEVVIAGEGREVIVSPKIDKSDKFFPVQTLQQLYDRIDNIRDLFYVMWHCETGVRISDIVGVKRKDRERLMGQEIDRIDWDEHRIKTYDHKKNAWRWVYYPVKVESKLKQWLKEMQNQDMLGRELLPLSEKTCNRILQRWCREIDFKYWRSVGTHWCRHTFIRLSRRAGRDIKAVQQNTGDTIKTLLEWYSDLSGEDMRREIEGRPLVNV